MKTQEEIDRQKEADLKRLKAMMGGKVSEELVESIFKVGYKYGVLQSEFGTQGKTVSRLVS
ncbi:hypothetical protein ACFLS9_07815 [Bacteroidota bacterium]